MVVQQSPMCARALHITKTRYRPRFFDQVGHQTTFASIGNKHFSLNDVIVRPTKIMNNLLKDCKIRTVKVIFEQCSLAAIFLPHIVGKWAAVKLRVEGARRTAPGGRSNLSLTFRLRFAPAAPPPLRGPPPRVPRGGKAVKPPRPPLPRA